MSSCCNNGYLLSGLKNNGDNYMTAVVALPGIKMWAGKQREDQVCTKDGWTQWCSLCQRWPTEGKLQDKYTLLRTHSLSLSLSLSVLKRLCQFIDILPHLKLVRKSIKLSHPVKIILMTLISCIEPLLLWQDALFMHSWCLKWWLTAYDSA